jgi:hypothetical protein
MGVLDEPSVLQRVIAGVRARLRRGHGTERRRASWTPRCSEGHRAYVG